MSLRLIAFILPAVCLAGCPAQPSPTATSPWRSVAVTVASDDVAVVNAGSRDGLRAGQIIRIYRNDTHIADLLVTDVKPSIAGGVVQNRWLEPRKGDEAMLPRDMASQR
jgi:uncharacterized lipoprotein YajG